MRAQDGRIMICTLTFLVYLRHRTANIEYLILATQLKSPYVCRGLGKGKRGPSCI